MGFSLDNDTYIDGVAEAKYNVLKNFGIFAGYHYMSVEVEDSDIYVDASLSGSLRRRISLVLSDWQRNSARQ